MRILLTAGASGGHIHPACSLAEELVRRQVSVLLVVPSSGKNVSAAAFPCDVRFVPLPGVRPRITWHNLLDACRFVRGSAMTFAIVKRFRPDAVVAFGAVASIPAALSAKILGIPLILHEQNVVPGKANRFLSSCASAVAVSFSDTGKYFGRSVRTVCTGNPVRALRRQRKSDALRFFGLEEGKFTILVTGGSHGSSRINTACCDAFSGELAGAGVQVIHIAGRTEAEAVAGRYESAGVSHRTFGFLQEMEQAYSAADLAVTRAGASTLSELVFFGLPAIIVPYPFASGHQAYNAAYLKDRGGCDVISDGEFTRASFAAGVHRIRDGRLAGMRRSLENLAAGNAAALLADLAMRTAAGK